MIRKIFIAISVLLGVWACDGVEGGNSGKYDPLSECVIPSGAEPGAEAVIQWNGFEKSAGITLRDPDGRTYPAQVKVVTPSGLIFVVPSGLLQGMYSVLLADSGVVLGQIEIFPVELPVSGLSFPSAVSPGDVLQISGTGFDDSFSVIFSSSSGRVEFRPELVPGGIAFQIPGDTAAGIYRMILTDGTDEWILDDSFDVAVRKRISSVKKSEPYEGATVYVQEYEVEYADGEVAAVVYRSSYVDTVEGSVDSVLVEDRYAVASKGYFKVDGGASASNNFNFEYLCDGDGRILSADVLRYSRNNPEGARRVFQWVYDGEGLPTDVTYELDGVVRSLQWYQYEDGNLLSTARSVFSYEGALQSNNPFALDVGHGFDMMHIYDEPFLFVPYLTGMWKFSSRLLPAGYMAVSGLTTRVFVPFAYEFDSDGYVTSMSWSGGDEMIEFVYDR